MNNTEDELVETLKYGRCNCGINAGTADHRCPYQAEINDDYLSKCNCCEICRQNCADDV